MDEGRNPAEESGWVNYGDVNFFEHGGTMVKKDPDIEGAYNFFHLARSGEGDRFAFSGTVTDLNDYKDEGCLKETYESIRDARNYACIGDMLRDDPMMCVADLVPNYGCGPFEFSPRNCRGTGEYSMRWEDFKVNDQELVGFMQDLDIPAEYIPDLEYEAVSRYGSTGTEATFQSNNWEEIKDFAHGKLMSGYVVEITDRENGSSVMLDPGEYAEKFDGEFPVDPRYGLEVDYGDGIERE